jgi:uncharacterized protein
MSVVGIPPAVTAETEAYWTAANEGKLVVQKCLACGARSFPPRGVCRTCRARDLVPVEITGTGRIYSYTVNHQRWLPDLAVPYAIVLVEFAEHPGVRVTGRLRGCSPDEVRIGMTVEIGFEPGPGDQAIPSFICSDRVET